MIHEFKILPDFFTDVINGEKTFEIRKKDRPFHKGDLLALNEFDGQHYTGNGCLVYVDYIMDDSEYVKADMVVMAIKPCKVYLLSEPFSFEKMHNNYSVPLATKSDDEREW